MFLQTQVGQTAAGLNSNPILRSGKLADGIVSELHGRFYEQNYNGNLFSWGKTATALSANSITLTATTTPIIGVWNPASSLVNLVILQATCVFSGFGANNANPGGNLVWAVSTGNGVISTGNAPWNRKTLSQNGSQAKGFDLATALTAITNNLVIASASAIAPPAAIQPAAFTVVGPAGGVENLDGSIIVPPCGVLALLNTTSTTTISAAASLLWEEVPV